MPIGSAAKEPCLERSVIIEDVAIRVVDGHKHLGVVLYSDLRWCNQVHSVTMKAKQCAGLLRHVCPQLSPAVAKPLYLSYVRPVMEYSSPLWSGAISKEQLLTLERIQASVARRILRCNFSTPKAELFRILEWPTLQWRRAVASTLFLHGILFNRPQQSILSKEIFPFAKRPSHHGIWKPFQLVLPTTTGLL